MSRLRDVSKTGLKIVQFILLSAAPYPLRALVLSLIWKWFAIPYGIRPITYFYSLGIVLFSALILITVHKNHGEHLLEDADQSTMLTRLYATTGEMALRLGLIMVFAFSLHLIWGPK